MGTRSAWPPFTRVTTHRGLAFARGRKEVDRRKGVVDPEAATVPNTPCVSTPSCPTGSWLRTAWALCTSARDHGGANPLAA